MALPEAAHFGGAKKPVKERPLVPPLIDDRVGLTGAVLCMLVAGREGPGVC